MGLKGFVSWFGLGSGWFGAGEMESGVVVHSPSLVGVYLVNLLALHTP